MASRYWRLASRYWRIAGVADALDGADDIGNVSIIIHRMRILALDTTTRTGSIAIARGGVLFEETVIDPSLPIATRLPGDLMTLLSRHDVELRDIDAFAVATGPGSFTGLRIGIATMQGFAFANDRPLLGISALDALASIAGNALELQGAQWATLRVATWVDAWRGEVYAGLYEDGSEARPPVVGSPMQVLQEIGGARTLFIGDGAATYRDAITLKLGLLAQITEPTAPLLAGAIANLAATAVAAGHHPRPHAIRPLYVRRPDAELARERP
jgi:tRNA threonylcarbamoyladenosine biosynthesis protein TsaB